MKYGSYDCSFIPTQCDSSNQIREKHFTSINICLEQSAAEHHLHTTLKVAVLVDLIDISKEIVKDFVLFQTNKLF